MLKNPHKNDNEHRQAGESKERHSISITPLSVREKVRSKIPVNTSKYDKHEKIDEMYQKWHESATETRDDCYEKILFLFYDLYKPRIQSIAKNYRNLSPIFDDDDLLQTGLLGLLQALLKYDHAEHINMKFSTYLEWSIRNVFQRAIGNDDKLVEVYDQNYMLDCTMNYQDFLAKKKGLLSRGFSYIIKSRQCYISDERSEACLPISSSHDRWLSEYYDLAVEED